MEEKQAQTPIGTEQKQEPSPTVSPEEKKSSRKSSCLKLGIVIVLGLVIVGGGILGFWWWRQKDQSAEPKKQEATTSATVGQDKVSFERESFAKYEIKIADFSPQVPEYDIESDFSDVANYKRFSFNAQSKEKLANDYFVVVEPNVDSTDRDYDEFFNIYEDNRYGDIPSFITTDSALHAYHLIFDDALKTLEQAVFFEKIKTVTNYMFKQSKEHYNWFDQQGETELKEAALRNVGYFAVASNLIGETVETPAYVKDLVDKELSLIDAHKEITCSDLMNLGPCQNPAIDYKEDYSQYVPRGHYTRTERLKKYFKAMMWYGRMTFRQKDDSENLSALLLTYDLSQDENTLKAWADVYDATVFMVGNADDLGVYEYGEIFSDSFGSNVSLANLTNQSKQKKFLEQIKLLEGPQLNSMVIFDETINPDREEEIKGFRFMGQRYTLDADVFQRLIYREVKENNEGNRRMLPKSLDILAAMGSSKALTLLEQAGDTEYENYSTNLNKMKSKIGSLEENLWTSNLYFGWLYMLKPLMTTLGSGYPSFMQNDAWVYKDMNTYQGSWTELKHDTILYAKQVYAELGGAGGAVEVELDDRGYIEPRVDVYGRLEALAKTTHEGLNSRGLIAGLDFEFTEEPTECLSGTSCEEITYKFKSKDLEENLDNLKTMAAKLKSISIKELKNEALSDEDYQFIREFGGKIEHLWLKTLHDETANVSQSLDENPVMLVADVATDPNGEVLEEGTGRVMEIYTLIPVPGGTADYYRVARGAVWSQYEFKQPLSDRLTDEKWQEQVRADNLPELESWKKNYILEETNVEIKSQPMSYKDAIDEEWMTLDEARTYCTDGGGTFEECGSVCKESEPNCSKACEPVCRYY